MRLRFFLLAMTPILNTNLAWPGPVKDRTFYTLGSLRAFLPKAKKAKQSRPPNNKHD